MTAEELLELPDDDFKYELVAGELIRMPPGGWEHGTVAARLARLLDEYAEAHDLGKVCAADTGFILQRNPDIVRGPDAAFVTKARASAVRDARKFSPFGPDLAVEVVSPSERVSEIQEKLREYFAAGTRMVWVVYPSLRAVHIYRSPLDVRRLGENDSLDGEDVLPGFACPVRRCFS